jgi:hypothetical protein
MDAKLMLEAVMPALVRVALTAAKTAVSVVWLLALTPGKLMVANSLDIATSGAGACKISEVMARLWIFTIHAILRPIPTN